VLLNPGVSTSRTQVADFSTSKDATESVCELKERPRVGEGSSLGFPATHMNWIKTG
jgi:hypothetical protein